VQNFFAAVADRWPVGREDYHWLVLPDPAIVRERLVQPYRDLTHREGLAPVRPDRAHITIQHAAPVPEISGAEIAQITGLVREECAGIASFTVTAGRAQAWGSGIVCPLRPEGPLRRLWEVTTGAGREVTGDRFEIRPAAYHAHLALAYAVGQVDDGPLRRWLAVRAVAEAALAVDGLVLVAQSHDGRQISWRRIDDVPLNVSNTEPGPGLPDVSS
jgi:2'-5' RNA ligase